MIFEKGHVSDIHIAYIGGGSRGWAWSFMMDLALEPSMSGIIRLYDIDQGAAYANEIIGNKISSHPDAKGKWEYKAVNTLAEGLEKADFVIISILPATFEEMRSDVHLPEKYGIYQSVGDTTGPGGLVRALRTIPMYITIAEAIRKYAPDAWVISYTNPMALCIRTLYDVFPGIHAIGCCHEVFHMQELLCDMIYEQLGVDGITRKDIRTNLWGLNHFTWCDKAVWREVDLVKEFYTFAKHHASTGYEPRPTADKRPDVFPCHFKVQFDLFLKYGYIPAGSDRHISEFMPPWYLKDPDKTKKDWGFSLTSVEYRIQDLKARLARSERLQNGEEDIVLSPSGEEGHLMMKALLGLGDMLTNVNLPNAGQIPNIKRGIVVETNAVISQNNVSPTLAGNIPDRVMPLISPHLINQDLIYQAALRCDRSLALIAMLNEPLVQISPCEAETMLNEMLENTRQYLPAGWFH